MSSNLQPSFPIALDRQSFCAACGRFATGVIIATVLDTAGAPHGMTANSFTSVSLDPPLVLICVDLRARILEQFRRAEYFGINVLAEHQRNLSVHFSRSGYDRFDGVEWYPGSTGVPLLPGTIGVIECALRQMLDTGDHAIVLGEVLRAHGSEGKPLVYFGSAYRQLSE